MYKVYYLVSYSTNWYYIGITKNSLKTRFTQHKSSARRGVKSPLYDCMRKYEDFLIVLKKDFLSHEEACNLEILLIEEARASGHKILNLAKGGEGGFVIPEKGLESWKDKLRAKRKGRKPALGMEHTEENKKLFSDVSKKYWFTQDTYDVKKVCSVSFKEARDKHGISKTHYYRLKRSLSSD